MTRYIVLITAIVTVVYLLSRVVAMIRFNKCKSCNGEGFWLGTRGDKNHCTVCAGSGKG